MENFSAEISELLKANYEELKDWMQKKGCEIVELAEPTVEDVTDYRKIAQEIVLALTSEEDYEPSLGERLRGYTSPTIQKIAKQMVESNKGVPIRRKTSNVYQHIADNFKEVDRTGRSQSDIPHRELMTDVCNKIMAEHRGQREEVSKRKKWYERHEDN